MSAARRTMDRAHQEALITAAYASLPDEARKADLLAKVRRVHYDASIQNGFTHEQALVLCMKPEFS